MREIDYNNYFWQNDLVRLRPWSEDDWEWDYCSSFDTNGERFGCYNVDFPPTVSDAKEYSQKVADLSVNNNRTVFAIETLDGIHVGRINILLDDEKNGGFGIGLKIGKEHRGNGYGTSAMKLLLKYAFIERRLNKCSESVIEGNEGSIKMHKKLGFKQEAVLKQNIYTNGRYHSEIYFGLLKDEYLKMHESIE